MKKVILVMSLFVSYFINAQISTTIPNPDFEIWTNGKPDSWDLSNENIVGVQYITTTQYSSAQSGSNALQLETVQNYVPFGGYVTLPGLATLGDFVINVSQQTAQVVGGLQWNSKPSSFKGYYKTAPMGFDKSFIIAYFTKLNPFQQSVDTIGKAKLLEPNTINTWTQFDIPVVWTSNDLPEIMNIIIASSDVTSGTGGNVNYTKGSKMWIDNLSFEYVVTGMENVAMNGGAKVFPNPVKDKLRVTFDNDVERTFRLFGLGGNMVFEKATSEDVTIDMSEYPNGVYILDIQDPSLTIQNSVKIIK